MTDSKSSKIKEWGDTHFPIHIVIIFMTVGILLTWHLGNIWFEPAALQTIKHFCPDMAESCLNTLSIQPTPLYMMIPLGFTVLGMIIAQSVRLLA